MVEILFGDSESGSMKVAKCKNAVEKRTGEVIWIPGSSDEVICLGFLLDVGDIKEPVDSTYRKKLLDSVFHHDFCGDSYCKELKRLESFLREGQAVRIWYSDAPYSRCGYYFVSHFLQEYENPVSVVKLPEYRIKKNTITIYHNWGNMPAEEFSYFLQYEQTVSQTERRRNEILWSELTKDNSPLRAVVNGEVIGVAEDFYDFLIWRQLSSQPVKEARLFGSLLGKFPISISDWWYATRIETLIQQGRIKVVEDSESECCYGRVIARAD